MYEDLMSKVYDQSKVFIGPMMGANKIAVRNFEKLVAMQMANMQYFVDLGMSQLKTAVEVDSPKAMQDYLGKQAETAMMVREKLMDDAKALVEIGNGMKEEFSQLAEENAQNFTKATGQTRKKTA